MKGTFNAHVQFIRYYRGFIKNHIIGVVDNATFDNTNPIVQFSTGFTTDGVAYDAANPPLFLPFDVTTTVVHDGGTSELAYSAVVMQIPLDPGDTRYFFIPIDSNSTVLTGITSITFDRTNIIAAPVDLVDNTVTAICFGSSTLIATTRGSVAAGELLVGDQVETMDHGFQLIHWIQSCRLDSAKFTAHPNLRPIRIRAGAFGSDLPERDLVVSPQHRMLVSSKITHKDCCERRCSGLNLR